MDTMTYLIQKTSGLPKNRVTVWVEHWTALVSNAT